MKQFIFLYPEEECFVNEFDRRCFSEEEQREFRLVYSRTLNRCIDARYRQRGFKINYAILDDCTVSDIIELQEWDKVIKVGLDSATHNTERPDGTHPYPDQDFILNQLGDLQILRVAGFHMWDCVEKLARRAYERGIEVLVDEDLTEFFIGRLRDPAFRVDKYPTFDPRTLGSLYEDFIENRRGKPWLWQDYTSMED